MCIVWVRRNMPIRTLSSELQKKAEDELHEVPERIPEDLKHIRDWLAEQPYLHARTDDQWLLSFLRGCKFSLEKTKEKLDTYYTMRTILPEFFVNRDPFLPEMQEILSSGMCLPLPKTADPSAPRVVLIRKAAYDPDRVPITNLIKANLLIMDVMLLEDDTSIVAGQHAIQDLKDVKVALMLQMTPTIAKKAMTCMQHAYPIRQKGVHFVNIPSFFENMFNIIKPFLTEKMKSRVNVYSDANYDNLYKVIPRCILPKEYGGDGGSVAELTAEWKRKVEGYRDWFLEDEKHCTDEAKRPGGPKTASDVFGVVESFKELNID